MTLRTFLSLAGLSLLFSSCSLAGLIQEESRLEQIRYYFFKENDYRGYNVASKGYANSVPLARSEIIDFLSDDSDLCKAIEEKRIEPFEFDIICETYSPENGTAE